MTLPRWPEQRSRRRRARPPRWRRERTGGGSWSSPEQLLVVGVEGGGEVPGGDVPAIEVAVVAADLGCPGGRKIPGGTLAVERAGLYHEPQPVGRGALERVSRRHGE